MIAASLLLDATHEVPTGLNILAWLCIPLLAFALPWLLLKRLPKERAQARTPAMLGATLPAFVIACVAATLASGDWFQGLEESSTEILHASRYPPNVQELFLRTGISALGAFAIIWISGVIGERMSKREGQAAGDSADQAEGSTDA